MKTTISLSYLKQIENIEATIFGQNSYNLSELEYFNKNNFYNFFIIAENEIIVSYAITQETIDYLEIIKLATIKGFRNRNYASNILKKIIQESNKDIRIEVSDIDDTKKFYLKNKFEEIGTRKKYYIDSSNCINMIFKKQNIL